ncbi:MAG TPA: hypothetical protein VHG35_18445 [Gemmatimonadales bacterium]|nr:hypothetical protein [Gemmatimonadales bacterium]
MALFSPRGSTLVRCAIAVCGGLVLSACASRYAQVPPRLDLRPHGRIALVTFTAAEENRAMGELATRRFAEALLAGQPGVELLELHASDSLLRSLPPGTDPIVLAQALGRARDIPAVFVGELKVSPVKPRARLSVSDVNVRATVSAELGVRLLSTRAGGTLWRSSSAASGTVARMALAGGLPSLSVRDSEEAYDNIVSSLVDHVTADLRPTWVKQ